METVSTSFFQSLLRRPRRNRQSAAIRSLGQETHLHASGFVVPLFVREGLKTQEPVAAMPGIFRLSSDLIIREAEKALEVGIPAVMLFPVIPIEKKDSQGSEALRADNLINNAIRQLKRQLPELCVMVDVALDPYTDHGHDGLLGNDGNVMNDDTVERLAEQALGLAAAGADVIAPSDMMDGRVAYIRQALDAKGFTETAILAYAAKYASAFYGPFRDAVRSGLKSGDKKGYQLNPANSREALLECALDEAQGADMLLIKPALPYLDVISKVRANTNLPLGAYHVSGEYTMVMAAADKGWLEADKVFHESLLGIKRAGADFIISYAALRVARMLKS